MMLESSLLKSSVDIVGRDATSRKDRPIEETAADRLKQSGYYAFRAISCRFHEGVLILDGRVSSYYLKQIAQTLVCTVEGVEELDNRVHVGTPSAESYSR